ncbi:phytanoyl-CoA dioxygenase family protein [Streptomyces nogalater]
MPRVTVPLRAGDCTFHHARTVHSAGANSTDEPRLSTSAVYMDATAAYRPTGIAFLDDLPGTGADPLREGAPSPATASPAAPTADPTARPRPVSPSTARTRILTLHQTGPAAPRPDSSTTPLCRRRPRTCSPNSVATWSRTRPPSACRPGRSPPVSCTSWSGRRSSAVPGFSSRTPTNSPPPVPTSPSPSRANPSSSRAATTARCTRCHRSAATA